MCTKLGKEKAVEYGVKKWVSVNTVTSAARTYFAKRPIGLNLRMEPILGSTKITKKLKLGMKSLLLLQQFFLAV